MCEDLDAKTLALSQFGYELQFKNTSTCRSLVWNFHCLAWVAATFERVMDGAQVSCASSNSNSSMLPLPPCRSLCVEVADKCVYSYMYRPYLENVCGNIACVSEAQENATANSSTPLKQAECVKGAWETAANNSFSRCSIREYVVPTAAIRLASPHWIVLVLAIVLMIV